VLSCPFVIWQFLISFPLFFFLVAGTIHITQVAYLSGATEQASFFAARSELVDEDGENLSERSVDFASRTSMAGGEPMRLSSERRSGVSVTTVSLNLRLHRRSPLFDRRLPFPELSGSTPIPRREEE